MIKLGENFEIDLEKLISTRLLIQANSGGGKSYAIRKLLEESHGQVQQIVLDLEGEFSSLREKYDYLLVGQDGEIPARIQTAELLARKLLKLNVSAIIDLSELKKHERILFVKRFLDSLVHAPKDLWHPCLVVVDEAHQFCPEGAKSESGGSVIDLCTRGRKRGFCAVLATQRISKLNKDAAAECNNQMVGRTQLDIDQRRAADTLGITNKKEILELRNLEDGEFNVFGPAIGREVKKVQVGRTKTVHLDSKHVMMEPTKTPENIKKIMKDVIDLPKQADTELKNLTDYKNRVVELKRDLKKALNSQPKPIIKTNEAELKRAHRFGFEESEKLWKEKWKDVFAIQKQLKSAEDFVRQFMHRGSKVLEMEFPRINPPTARMDLRLVSTPKPLPPRTPPTPEPVPTQVAISEEPYGESPIAPLGICGRKIYSVLYANPEKEITKIQMSLLSGYSSKSGSFRNALCQLNQMGLLERVNGNLKLQEVNAEFTEEGFGEISKELWTKSLGICSRRIFEFLLENEMEFSKEEVAERVGYSVTSGSFRNAVCQLNSLGLIQRVNTAIKINPEILEL